jgi:hypothetical protein
MSELLPPKTQLLMVNEGMVNVQHLVNVVCSSVTDGALKVSLVGHISIIFGMSDTKYNAHRISDGTSGVVNSE